jgi:hypothetical protein
VILLSQNDKANKYVFAAVKSNMYAENNIIQVIQGKQKETLTGIYLSCHFEIYLVNSENKKQFLAGN